MSKILYSLIFAIGFCFMFLYSVKPEAKTKFHTKEELQRFMDLEDGSRTPIDSGEYFLGSINCKGCHGHDSASFANIDPIEGDVNVFDDWESTMMGLSAKDPLWRAKVSHEILVNPGHASALQTKCTSCHAPMGHFSAMFKGQSAYTINDLLADTLGLDGVSCMSCHTIAPDSLGLAFSGLIHYDTTRKIFGPYPNPQIGPMQLYTGFIPTYSEHTHRSQICASCHTLITNTADLNGNPTGGTFVEQATYHEWLNSEFNSDQPCQSCHMPQIKGPVVIANGYINLPPRSPFNKHKFHGANVTMLNLMKNNKNALGIQAQDESFDSTIAITRRLLESALQLNVQVDSITQNFMYVKVNLTNKSGHKFPSGYPSRRAYISLAVLQQTDTLFHSGKLQPDMELNGNDLPFEPHYQTITDDSQVQIYEMVMGDVNGNRTTVLERAADFLKDNRIPPSGFSSTHSVYDTVKIVGVNNDPDFNKNGSIEGTGKDVVYYKIPISGFSGEVSIKAGVYYQSIPPRYFTEMFSMHSPAIDSFKNMYDLADKSPIKVVEKEINDIQIPIISVFESQDNGVLLYPTVSSDGVVYIHSKQEIQKVEVFSLEGKLLQNVDIHSFTKSIKFEINHGKRLYLVRVSSGDKIYVRKVLIR